MPATESRLRSRLVRFQPVRLSASEPDFDGVFLLTSEPEFEDWTTSESDVSSVNEGKTKDPVDRYMMSTNNMLPAEEREADEAFIEQLVAATGEPDLFKGLDPSFWRSVDEETIEREQTFILMWLKGYTDGFYSNRDDL